MPPLKEMIVLAVVRELNHVAIRVANMDESLRFYRDILGGTVIRDVRGPEGKGHFVYVQLAEGVIELIQGKAGSPNLGLQHIAFLTSKSHDINSAADAAREKGYEFTVEPKMATSGDGYLCFFKDKGGATYEFIQRDEDIRIPGLKNDKILEFDHISIRADETSYTDTQELLQGLLGMKVRRLFEKPNTAMEYYQIGPDTIEILYGKNKPKPDQPIIHIALRVPCAKEMYELLTTNGITASVPNESGMGGFFITNATGPDGEIVEFLDRPSLDEYQPTK